MNRPMVGILVMLTTTALLAACGSTGLEAISQTNASPTSSAVAKPLPSPIPPEPLDPITGVAATPTTVALPDSTVAPTGAWQTYQSQAGGYTVEYPADWTVNEQVGTDGSVVTTFSPADGNTGITVIVQSGEFAGAGNSDIPNTRCEQAMVGGMTGMRCFDTLNFVTSTTLVADGKTFMIATLGKRVDESIYNHFLVTLQVI